MRCIVCKNNLPREALMVVTSKATGISRLVCRPEFFYDDRDEDDNLVRPGFRPKSVPCFRYAAGSASTHDIRLLEPAVADYQPWTYPVLPYTAEWTALLAEAGIKEGVTS